MKAITDLSELSLQPCMFFGVGNRLTRVRNSSGFGQVPLRDSLQCGFRNSPQCFPKFYYRKEETVYLSHVH